MKESLKTIKIGNFLQNEISYSIYIYKRYIKIEVALPIDQLMRASEIGGVEHERKQLNKLLRDTFNSPYKGLLLFHNEQDAHYRLSSFDFILPDLSNGGWSKTAVITFNNNSVYVNIENALRYIDTCLEGSLSREININALMEEISIKLSVTKKNSQEDLGSNLSQEKYLNQNKSNTNNNSTSNDASGITFIVLIWIMTILISIFSGIMAWNWIEPDNFWGVIGFLIAWGLFSKIGHFLATIIFGVLTKGGEYLD